jgi:hypothetical protein
MGPTPNPTATTAAATALTSAPLPTSSLAQVPTTGASSEPPAVVVFIKDGDILVWEEATGQTRTILDAGDAINLTMSDDGEVLAFLRRSVIGDLNSEWHEQSALWAVDRTGENPRELVSAGTHCAHCSTPRDQLHQRSADGMGSDTHRLLFSGWTYFVQAERSRTPCPRALPG